MTTPRSSSVAAPDGFTLVELAITIALAGIVLLALVFAFHEKARLQETNRNVQSATFLVNQLMDEIRTRSFADPQSPTSFGREAGDTQRAWFDDVDDYNGWWTNPPSTIEGVTLSNYLGFTERAVVTNVWSTNLNSAGVTNSTGFKRITVIASNRTVVVSNQSVVSKYD